MPRRYSFLVVFALLLCALASAQAQVTTINGRVVGVVDGDTITVALAGGAQQIVRLKNIDAPERDQAAGSDARQFLAGLIFEKKVTVYYCKRDRYGRIVGKVFLGSRDVALELIQAGHAWHFKKYENELCGAERQGDYASAEIAGRREQKGLWKEPAPEAPWLYRVRRRDERAQARAAEAAATANAPRSTTIPVHPSAMINKYPVVDMPSFGSGRVRVRGYTRRDGTSVSPHTRSRPRPRN